MTLQELYIALCALWGVDEIKDEHAILLGDTVLDMVAYPSGDRTSLGGSECARHYDGRYRPVATV